MQRSLIRYIAAVFLAVSLIGAQYSFGAVSEDDLKATYIHHFIKLFVTWPDGKAVAKQSHIDVCVLGDSAIANTTDIFKAASDAKQTFSLVPEKEAQRAAEHCHVLFISRSESGSLDSILEELAHQPVLTISDIDGFAERGGMIEFVVSDNKVKFIVNTKSVNTAGLHVDAGMLENALKVIDK